MGKRKRATKPPPKKKTAKLEKIFDCPFCGHEETVDCVIERDINVGKVECRVCGVKFSCMIHRLEEEIDVYSRWIDACEEANKEAQGAEEGGVGGGGGKRDTRPDLAEEEEGEEEAVGVLDDESEED